MYTASYIYLQLKGLRERHFMNKPSFSSTTSSYELSCRLSVEANEAIVI